MKRLKRKNVFIVAFHITMLVVAIVRIMYDSIVECH